MQALPDAARDVLLVDGGDAAHLCHTIAEAERWAVGLSNPAYAIDDETAFKVVDGSVEVVSEVHWKLFQP